MMHVRTKRFAGTLLAAAVLAGGTLAGTASAQQQNGLVNVAIGDIEILNDANIGVAAQFAANVCGVKVGPVAVLGTAVDRSGDAEVVCGTGAQEVTITQD
jgi:hypothetical protein